MRVYSYSKARQQLAELLNRARREGEVEIRRRDGQTFVVRPTARGGSPLEVLSVDTGLTRDEVVGLVRESRQSTRRLLTRRRGNQAGEHEFKVKGRMSKSRTIPKSRARLHT